MKKIKKISELIYKRLAIYFYYTAKPHHLNPIHILRKYNEITAKRKLNKNKELWNYLTEVMNRSQSIGCEFSDYLELYKIVKSLAPKYILELGSGISSSAIAYALKERFENLGDKAIFISMEESYFYHQQIKDIFPDDLKRYVKFLYSKRKEKRYGNFLGCFYESILNYPYDFVYIDGPTLRATPNSPKCFNSDLINIVMESDSPIYGVLDQRIGTYWVLKKLLPTANIKYNPVKKITTIRDVSKKDLVYYLSKQVKNGSIQAQAHTKQ